MEYSKRTRLPSGIKSNQDICEDGFEILDIIYKQPQAVIWEKSVEEINSFLTGYFFAMYRGTGISCDFDRLFQKFIEQKYPSKQSRYHWHVLIRNNNSSDEFAFEEFYRFLDEFKKMYRDGQFSEIDALNLKARM